MGLKAKDRVVFTLMPDGTTVMRAKSRSVTSLRGMLENPGKKVSISQMRHS